MSCTYDDCLRFDLVPEEPLLVATGAELNEMIQLLRESSPDWYWWNAAGESYEHSYLPDLHFIENIEYDLRELGWFEWDGCVWNEPVLFAYNKWKHVGHPDPSIILIEE